MYCNNKLLLLAVMAVTQVWTSGATTPSVAIHSTHLRSNSIANHRNTSNKSASNGIYFSDSPLNDGEGSADGPDDDLDENASGKGEDDEDSATKDIIDKEGSGSRPTGSGPDSDSDDDEDDGDGDLELGSGDESLFISSTERPIIRPDTTKAPVTTPEESKDLDSFETKKNEPIEEPTDNQLPDQRHAFETSTRFPSTRHPIDTDDGNKEDNDVATMYMGPRSQMTPASFFARPGILAAVIGGAVVGLLCAILLVMFIVYRMRKKDEGSYALDEHKRSTAANPYARGASKELYA